MSGGARRLLHNEADSQAAEQGDLAHGRNVPIGNVSPDRISVSSKVEFGWRSRCAGKRTQERSQFGGDSGGKNKALQQDLPGRPHAAQSARARPKRTAGGR